MITSETFFLLNTLKLLIDLARTCFSIVYFSEYHNYVDTINVNTYFEILLKNKAKIIKPIHFSKRLDIVSVVVWDLSSLFISEE